MKYLFTNKNIKIGDIGVMLCTNKQLLKFKFLKYFSSYTVESLNRIGIYIIRKYPHKCLGYLVYKSADTNKIVPYYVNDTKIYFMANEDNIIGILKYPK